MFRREIQYAVEKGAVLARILLPCSLAAGPSCAWHLIWVRVGKPSDLVVRRSAKVLLEGYWGLKRSGMRVLRSRSRCSTWRATTAVLMLDIGCGGRCGSLPGRRRRAHEAKRLR